jgi:proton-dependent oligopeptide transporter, POT family
MRRAGAPRVASDWFGQPRGLSVLFLTQMWEEFSFYGMRTLLVFYMTRGLAFSPAKASLIYGAYTGAAYFTPILGGLLADRWMGRSRAVVVGASVMAAGHFMMAVPSLFFPALAAIAMGNGLFLPSLPSQIDGLYASDDPRRGSAYTVYYAGLNLGAVLAPLVCGGLGERFGWHWGFAAAGVGMLVGLGVYIAGRGLLAPEAAPKAAAATARVAGSARTSLVLAGVLIAVVLFRGAYEQAGNSIALWTGAAVDRHAVAGLQIPMTWFQSLNPIFVLALAPLLVAMRARAGRAVQNPILTMAWGAAIAAVAFAALALVAAGSAGGQANWLWLVAFFALYTWGELHILPTGLALFGRLAPGGYAATGIAIWYGASFAGNLLAGGLGALWGQISASGFFAAMAGLALTAAAGLSLLARESRQ